MNQDDDNTRTHVVLTQGTIVSQYRIVEKIGAGGMGEVYLAEDTKLKRKVALKFMPAHLTSDREMRLRKVNCQNCVGCRAFRGGTLKVALGVVHWQKDSCPKQGLRRPPVAQDPMHSALMTHPFAQR